MHNVHFTEAPVAATSIQESAAAIISSASSVATSSGASVANTASSSLKSTSDIDLTKLKSKNLTDDVKSWSSQFADKDYSIYRANDERLAQLGYTMESNQMKSLLKL